MKFHKPDMRDLWVDCDIWGITGQPARARELIDLGEEAMEAAIPTVRDALSFLQ